MLLRDLEFFALVAETRSFRKAAVRASVTQPAITKGIQRLEDQLGLVLLERTRSGAELTEAGSAFLRHAHQLQRDLSDALRDAADLRSRSGGLLRVGVAPSLVVRFFRNPCAIVMTQRPAARFQLKIALSDELFASLRSGGLDLVLSSIPHPPDPAFDVRQIGFSPVNVVASKAHPLLAARCLRLEQLCDYPWILPRRGVVVRDWLDRTFASRGLKPPPVRVELDTHTDALLPIAAHSEILSVAADLPETDLRAMGLESIPLTELTWQRPVGALLRAGAAPSPLAEHFVETLLGRSPN
jgi:DNA-binding transcriptional LysR family regulator